MCRAHLPRSTAKRCSMIGAATNLRSDAAREAHDGCTSNAKTHTKHTNLAAREAHDGCNYCTVSTVQYCIGTAQLSTAQHSTAQHNTVLRNTVQ